MAVRHQPKIVTMFVIQNGEGDILLMRRSKQPYIDKWSLPHGKVHNTDSSILAAAQREAYEKLKVLGQGLNHAGDCYIRVHYGDTALTVTLAHVYAFNSDDIEITDNLMWARPHKLSDLDLAPAVEEIIARTFFRDPFYFEEYAYEW
jgi:ADP-ribose pyrophosphatase YjhB (NUDIX family)